MILKIIALFGTAIVIGCLIGWFLTKPLFPGKTDPFKSDTAFDIHIGEGQHEFHINTRDSIVVTLENDSTIVTHFDTAHKAVGLRFVP